MLRQVLSIQVRSLRTKSATERAEVRGGTTISTPPCANTLILRRRARLLTRTRQPLGGGPAVAVPSSHNDNWDFVIAPDFDTPLLLPTRDSLLSLPGKGNTCMPAIL